MTNRKARPAQIPEPMPAETVGDVAANDESIAAAAPTPATEQGAVAEQPAAGADDGATAPAAPAGTSDASAVSASPPPAPPKPAEVKPEKPKPAAKAKRLDPADDPTAGITGVPVDYVPTPAVP